MPIQLNDVELRVLGVLIEKSLAQPHGYPLTLNAVVLGANQKQNRDPIVEYAEPDVARALYALQQRRLVQQATPAPGARANRFAHNVVEELHWDRREQAIMAELMLRGRQTAGELRSRAARMTPLQDIHSVANILDELKGADPPLVEELQREPGRSANRFRHLLSPEANGPPTVASHKPAEQPAPKSTDTISTLVDRVGTLEAKVADLERIVAELRKGAGDPPQPAQPA